MEVTILIMLWFTTLIFTVSSIIWSKDFVLPLISFVLWASMAILVSQVTYVGFGSVNPIPYDYELGDPELPTGLIYIFWMLSVSMLLLFIKNVMNYFKSRSEEMITHNITGYRGRTNV